MLTESHREEELADFFILVYIQNMKTFIVRWNINLKYFTILMGDCVGIQALVTGTGVFHFIQCYHLVQ